MDVKRYFERIGLSRNTEVFYDYDFLKKLQLHHVLSVPYENLDIIDGKPISLELEKIYEKVVINRRGGYCFELNCLLDGLLRELGFVTESYFARFWRGENGVPLRRHRVICVFLENAKYIMDVGIGSVAPRIPLILEEGIVQEYFGESYRFERDELFGWVLYELNRGEWQKYFSFTEEKQLENDFITTSFYCEKHPDSKFNKNAMVAMKTPSGRIAIDGNVYKEFVDRELSYIEENVDSKRKNEILLEKFGIKT